MKKGFILTPFIVSLALVVTGFFVYENNKEPIKEALTFGAPTSARYERELTPVEDSKYYLGTSSPSLKAWRGLIVDEICLAGDCQTTWSAGGGEANTGASLGTGLNIFDSKSGVALRFNSIAAGSNITLSTTSDNNTIVIASTASGGGDFPFTVNTGYNSTSTALGLLGGVFSPASSTFSGPFRLSALSNGGLGVFGGLVSSGATTTAGTGLTYSGNAFNVNTSQNIATLSNLTSNGLVYTAGGGGTLNVIASSSLNVGTATALAANGGNCSAGNAPLGVDASGAVESCFDVWTEAENTSAGYIGLSSLSATWPIVYNSGTGAFTFTGLSTTTNSGLSQGFAYIGSGGLFQTVSTSTALASKQDVLVSGTNIKTINGSSILGSGDLTVTGSGSGLASSTPWTFGSLVVAKDNGSVTTISTSTIGTSQLTNDANFVDGTGVTNALVGFVDSNTVQATGTTHSLYVPSIFASTTNLNTFKGDVEVGTENGGPYLETAGADASPPFAFRNDRDTGMYSAGVNALGFATGGTNRLTISSTGNLTFGYSSSTAYSSFLTASSTNYFGAGLTDCDDPTNSKLLWSDTGFFSCGTDQGAGGGLTTYDAWTHPAAGQSATTSLMLLNGQASSTLFSANTGFFNNVKATSTSDTNTFAATSTFTTIQAGSTAIGSNVVKISPLTGLTTSNSESVGGIVNLNKGTTDALGVVLYGNSTGSQRSLSIVEDSASFAGNPLHVRNDGTESAFNILGAAVGKGVGKITHNSTGDADASILSLDASSAGYLGQGIFVDCTGGSCTGTNSALQISDEAGNNGNFKVLWNGKTGIASSTPTGARLSVNSVAGDNFSLWVGSTTAPWLKVANDGFGTTTLSGLTIAGSATSTSNVGFNLTGGCYAIGGICIGGGGSGITALGSGYASTTGTAITFSTSTLSFNGLTVGQTIVPTAGALTFTPTITGTLDNTGLTNSTISGIALGSNLADLTATNGTLTFSGTYNGGTARTIGLNLANANVWTAKQDFFGSASSTLFSANYGAFGATGTTTINTLGQLLVGTTTPWLNSMANFVGTTTVKGQLVSLAASTTANTTQTIDWSSGNTQKIMLTGNTSIVVNSTSSNPIDGGKYTLRICQDPTGSRTLTWANPISLRWWNGTTTITSTANKCTMIGMVYTAENGNNIYSIVASSTNIDIK